MNRSTKIVLSIVGGLTIICICIGVAGFYAFRQAADTFQQAITTDPAEVARVGDRIADYNLPFGYSEQYAMQILGYDTVGIGNETSNLIMLMQFPANSGLSIDQMEQQMQQSIDSQTGWRSTDMAIVDNQKMRIRGQEVALTFREGTNTDSKDYRQVSGVFQGKGGPTMLVIMGPIDGWDGVGFAEFIQSIR